MLYELTVMCIVTGVMIMCKCLQNAKVLLPNLQGIKQEHGWFRRKKDYADTDNRRGMVWVVSIKGRVFYR